MGVHVQGGEIALQADCGEFDSHHLHQRIILIKNLPVGVGIRVKEDACVNASNLELTQKLLR